MGSPIGGRAVPKAGSSFASKVKNVADVVGTIKGIYDTGQVLYQAGRTIAPIVAGFL